jgi:hypothetical protein
LSKVKALKRLCGGVVYYAAQANAQIDAEIVQKDHLWTETIDVNPFKLQSICIAIMGAIIYSYGKNLVLSILEPGRLPQSNAIS